MFADSHVDDIYLVIGNHTSPLKVGVRYDPARMTVPASLLQKGVYKQLADKAEKNARDKGYQYFNGPNTRLLRVTQELTDQTASGHEESGIMLEVGPLSWEQFTVLNCFLDQDVPGESGCGTLRQQFASRRMLFENTTDLRWCELSNLLTVHMIPITSDGYGLVTVRNPKTVSIAGSKLGSGITENIHRYLDEASAGHLDVRLHELMLPIEASKNVPIDYSPRGVPSPLLTAQRGFLEEVSERLYFDIRGDEHRFKFLNVVFDLKLFIPKLIGIVELEVNSDELRRMIHESPGKDHGEVREHHFLKLDAANANTRDFMGREWDLGGLAAFATAMQYWSVRVMGKR